MDSASLLLLLLILPFARAIYPNKECCDSANDPEGCRLYSHSPTDFDNCVGAIGVDCEGVQTDLSVFGKVDIVGVTDNNDGTVTIDTSVGSILHDLCCMKHPKGAFCTGTNYVFGATINPFGNADNDCACLMEWRKAAWNVIRKRTWRHTYPKADFSSDLTPRPDKKRKSWLPRSWSGNYLKYSSTWGLEEVQATAELCAPPGTDLDCPSEDNNCQVPNFWFSAKACAYGCNRRQRRRWNRNGRDHAHAGDSSYCCSGKFREVYWDATRRHGVCA